MVLPPEHTSEDLAGTATLAAVLDQHSSDLVVRFDRGLRILYANRAMERAARCPRGGLLGRCAADAGLTPEVASR